MYCCMCVTNKAHVTQRIQWGRTKLANGRQVLNMGATVEVLANNYDDWHAAMNRGLAAGLEAVGLAAEGYAKKACPVDTGNLRNSITHIVRTSEGCVYIGTNVNYAPYVELGTRKQKAQPYLRPAAANHTTTYRNLLEQYLKNG